MAGGVNVPLGSTWDPKGVKRAQQDLGRFNQQAKGLTSSISKSFLGLGAGLGAGLALGAITDQLGQMATMAAEDQKSVVALQKALSNVGLAGAAADAEAFVRQLMLATGIADEDLRSALQQAATATGDLAKSQRMLNDAADISAATGKDLSTVMTGLTKASLGNFGALTRLGIPLTQNTVKSKDFDRALGELESRFGGQAAAKAETYAGQLQRISTAADEAKESIGYALLGAIDDLSGSLGGADGAVGGITALGDGIASIIDQSAQGVAAIKAIIDALKNQAGASEDGSFQQEVWNKSLEVGGNIAKNVVAGPLYILGGAYGKLQEGLDKVTGKTDEANGATSTFERSLLDAASAMGRGADAAGDAGDGVETLSEKIAKTKSSAEGLQKVLDRLFGTNQSRIEDRIALKRMRAEGPGKNATADDARLWAVEYARGASAYANDFKSPDRQAQILQNAQAYIASQVGKYGVGKPGAFASSVIGAPASVTNPRPWEGMYNGNAPASQPVVNIAIQSVQVASGAAFDQLIKEGQRTAAASGGRFGDRYSAAVTR